MKKNIRSYKKIAFILTLLVALTTLLCMLWILSDGLPFSISEDGNAPNLTANIYQDGALLQSISLNAVEKPYTFTVIGENNCQNEIEVRPGSIGIVSADCPDKLCVHQGFIGSSRLPITCLPNRLVIQIQAEDITPDIVTY